MAFFIWVLGLFPKALFVLLLFVVVVVMLESASASSTEAKEEHHDKKKENVVGEAKLDNEGLKFGGAKKIIKKMGVKFVVGVAVEKVDGFEASGKPIKDSELLPGSTSEKVGFLNKTSEGKLVVGSGEGCMIMEDVADLVVVGKVNQLEGSDEPITVHELSESLSEKVGILDKPLEEGLDAEKVEGRKIVVEGGGVDKESEVMVSGERLVEECGDANMVEDVKVACAQGKGSKDVELLHEALDKEAADGKNVEGAVIGDYCGLKGQTLVNTGLGNLVVEQEIKTDVIGREYGLSSTTYNVGVEEHNAAAEEVAKNAGFFAQEVGSKSLDGENRLMLMNDVVDESEAAVSERVTDSAGFLEEFLDRVAVEGENGMALMNDNVLIDETDNVGGKRVPTHDEILGEELKRASVVSDARIDKSDPAGEESSANKATLLEENLETKAAEGKSEGTAGDLDKIHGGGEGSSHFASGGLENSVVEEVIKSKEFGSESKVEMVSDKVAVGVLIDNPDYMIANEEGLRQANVGEKAILKDKDVDDNGDDADDWEGVERSELEKAFAEAVNYVEYGRKEKDDGLPCLRSNVHMLLYGLHKLAVEGPCHVPQPMALKFSARAKWNAWQKLGSMSPEVAMEKYIKILADADPGWVQLSSAVDDTHDSLGSGLHGGPDTKPTSSNDPQDNFAV